MALCLRTMQHVFLDVEALGPPGRGSPFALGAVRFDTTGILGNWSSSITPRGQCDATTLAWLSRQVGEVLAQLRDGVLFADAWYEFQVWLFGHSRKPVPTTFWADDWSDFAWLDIECREHSLVSLRELGPQYDASGIIALVPAEHRPRDQSEWAEGAMVRHMAADDARVGALDLLAALKAMHRALPRK